MILSQLGVALFRLGGVRDTKAMPGSAQRTTEPSLLYDLQPSSPTPRGYTLKAKAKGFLFNQKTKSCLCLLLQISGTQGNSHKMSLIIVLIVFGFPRPLPRQAPIPGQWMCSDLGVFTAPANSLLGGIISLSGASQGL